LRETIQDFPLDDESLHEVHIRRRFGKGLEDFVISYCVREAGARKELVCYDCKHGGPHRDIRYLPKNDKRARQFLQGDIKIIEEEAYWDIVRNWKKYYEEYKSLKK
jgi:hypothetical protein